MGELYLLSRVDLPKIGANKSPSNVVTLVKVGYSGTLVHAVLSPSLLKCPKHVGNANYTYKPIVQKINGQTISSYMHLVVQ